MVPQWSHSIIEASRRAWIFPESSLDVGEIWPCVYFPSMMLEGNSAHTADSLCKSTSEPEDAPHFSFAHHHFQGNWNRVWYSFI